MNIVTRVCEREKERKRERKDLSDKSSRQEFLPGKLESEAPDAIKSAHQRDRRLIRQQKGFCVNKKPGCPERPEASPY